jgi:hypothetical protein
MNEFHLFWQWLWSRPFVKSLNYHSPVPRIFSHLISYLCFLVIGYNSLKYFASQSEKEGLESSYHNVWFLLAIGLFFCALSTDGYMDKRFPSAKSGFFAHFNPGKRDFNNPLVKLNVVVGILCLVSFMVGLLQTWAKP